MHYVELWLQFRLSYASRLDLVLATAVIKGRKGIGFIEHRYIRVLAKLSKQHRPDVSTMVVYIKRLIVGSQLQEVHFSTPTRI